MGLTSIVIFKQIKPEYAFLLRLALTVPVTVLLISLIQNVFNSFSAYDSFTGGYFEYLKIAVKVLGVCYLSQTGSDICRDCGEAALATQVELVGRIAALTVSLPVLKELLEFSVSLISK